MAGKDLNRSQWWRWWCGNSGTVSSDDTSCHPASGVKGREGAGLGDHRSHWTPQGGLAGAGRSYCCCPVTQSQSKALSVVTCCLLLDSKCRINEKDAGHWRANT